MKPLNKLLALLVIAILVLSGCTKQAAVETETVLEETTEVAEALVFPLTLRAGYSTGEDDPRGVALAYMK